MREGFLSLLVACMLFTSPVMACDINGETGFAPQNDMKIPVGAKSTSGMTEAEFRKTIARIQDAYTEKFEKSGRVLEIFADWKSETVNAFAKIPWFGFSSKNQVFMLGGLARHPKMTVDGLAMVVCHELGHHIGGAPKNPGILWGTSWASNEGQSDYFASMKCFRKVFRGDDNYEIMKDKDVDPAIAVKCKEVYGDAFNENYLCQRAATAGNDLSEVLRHLQLTAAQRSGNKTQIDKLSQRTRADNPDMSIVKKTYNGHPAAQCRMDTYLHGALCPMDVSLEVDQENPLTGVCNRSEGFETGVRPLCWYNPKS